MLHVCVFPKILLLGTLKHFLKLSVQNTATLETILMCQTPFVFLHLPFQSNRHKISLEVFAHFMANLIAFFSWKTCVTTT